MIHRKRTGNRIITSGLRSIRSSFARFLSLLIMSLLGVGVFAGIRATGPDMIHSLDTYLDEANTYDIYISYAYGLTDKDIDILADINSISDAEGGKQTDAPVYTDKKNYVIRIFSIPERINTVTLLDGRFPRNKYEIVIEPFMAEKEELSIDDTIVLDSSSADGSTQVVKIVGIVQNNLYFKSTDISVSRGNTSVGSGKVNYYAYCSDDFFGTDYYNSVYLTVGGALDCTTSSDKYLSLINKAISDINEVSQAQTDRRYNEFITDAGLKIDKEILDARNLLADTKDLLESSYQKLIIFKDETDKAAASLDEKKAELDRLTQEYSSAVGNGTPENTLAQMKAELDRMYTGYISDKEENDKAYETYKSRLAVYESRKSQLDSSYSEIDKKEADAREQLGKLTAGQWYVYDRNNDTTYKNFIGDTESIDNLSKLFPTVFFAVAVLISLISMNRMVEDDRNLIGTFKSLGFSDIQILFRYLLFSAAATLTGGIIGAALGIYIIPSLIWNIYRILFELPHFFLDINISYILIGLLIAFVCICGTTVFTAYRVLREKPAELMLARTPKSGKRVLLERMGFIWNHLNFSRKVTIRNIFRYKKRVIMTIVGIIGCTALLLTGFGLSNSIMDIPDKQFSNISFYNISLYYIPGTPEENIRAVTDNYDNILFTPLQMINATLGDNDVVIMVTDDVESLEKIILFKDKETKNTLSLDDGSVFMTEKLADITGTQTGDTITVNGSDNTAYKMKVTATFENYLYHYIVMTRATFESIGGTFVTNSAYIQTEDMSPEEEDQLCTSLLDDDRVLGVTRIGSLIESTTDMLSSLDNVILILIVLAAMLSFVVLYNLSNININERRREIATLKVLGFYDREVDRYITRENIILTVIGIGLGLVCGYFLADAVISTVEIDYVRFIHHIKLQSYLYSAAITAVFTAIVNIFTHFSLKRINMIDSLKSVE